ncbi:unnamed protein product [Brassica oleracea]
MVLQESSSMLFLLLGPSDRLILPGFRFKDLYFAVRKIIGSGRALSLFFSLGATRPLCYYILFLSV